MGVNELYCGGGGWEVEGGGVYVGWAVIQTSLISSSKGYCTFYINVYFLWLFLAFNIFPSFKIKNMGMKSCKPSIGQKKS